MPSPWPTLSILASSFALALIAGIPFRLPAQMTSNDAVVRGIDAAVAAREENVMAYTVTEHYSIFRNEDKDHPAAQVMVKTSYQKDHGKTYTIISQSGSSIILKQVIPRILDSEREINQPSNRMHSLLTSANYNMKVQAEDKVAGRDCLVVQITPRRSSSYLFTGKLWVDAADQSIVQLEGIASKSPSMFAGATQVSRTYDRINGYGMATHATAISNSWILGRTTIQIEYTGYQITLRNTQDASR
jgi:hypothetical protein